MSEAILQVTNLVKKIKGKTILDHVSFEVGQGDCLALIGPNGAGKTTLMSCILGDIQKVAQDFAMSEFSLILVLQKENKQNSNMTHIEKNG